MAATNDPAPAPTSGAAAASAPSLTSASSALGSSSAAAATQVPSAGGTQGLEEQEGPAVARGAFVVLEGLDRSGKTTQVKLLQSRLIEAGRRVQLMRFPGE